MLKHMYEVEEKTVKEIIKLDRPYLRQLSTSTIYKYATGKFGKQRAVHSASRPPGRPSKLSGIHMRAIKRAVTKLRMKVGNQFTVAAVQRQANLLHVELSTVRKAMYKLGYKSRVARRKGVLSEADKKLRRHWARRHKNKTKKDWCRDISCWTDIVGFEFKVCQIYII
jgi:hypothetical protein